jgi:hypothetical protein
LPADPNSRRDWEIAGTIGTDFVTIIDLPAALHPGRSFAYLTRYLRCGLPAPYLALAALTDLWWGAFRGGDN